MSLCLNEEQETAVNHSGSPLLIVAGPGSGKTKVIIERVVHLVRNGLKPQEVLCLTFSEKAAKEMQERLEKLIDITDMQISTFHSFAKTVLEDNILDSGVDLSGGVIKRSALLVWGLKNIDSFNLQHLEIGNNAVQIIESIIDGISTFKDEFIFPNQLEDYLNTKLNLETDEDERNFLLKLSDLLKVYYKYQEFQRERSVIDFDDMVIQAIDLFKRKHHVLSKYQKKYRHILVDEFQDNNYAQLELIKLLTSNNNVTVVGDDDQSIYRFQGAYLTNFQDFKEHFPNTTVTVLNQNYRSSKKIVNVASCLLSVVKNRQAKQLYSENEDGNNVTVALCSNESAEVEFVVEKIKNLIGQKIKRRDGSEIPLSFKDIVVLSRRKIEGKKFAKALKSYGIPTKYIGEANIFSAPIIRDFLAYLNIANSPTTSGIEITRLMKRHGITEQNIAKINHTAKKKARADPTNIDFVLDTIKNCHMDITQSEEVRELASQIQIIIQMETKHTISDFVYRLIMSVSDLYKRTLIEENAENRRNQLLLKEMYKIALEYESLNPHVSLKDFIGYLSLLGKFDIELPEEDQKEDAIQVTTIHQSKGKEFPVVFVVDISTNKLPLRYQAKNFYVPNDLAKGIKRDEDEKQLYLEEERRLLYVAMTRAQNLLFLTCSRRYGDNVKESKPSIFLDEIDYTDNPHISFILYDGNNSKVKMAVEEKLERMKLEIQQKAVSSINQMQLKSAILKIVDLAKIDFFEKNGNADNFNPSEVLSVSYPEERLNNELIKEKSSLINKEKLKLSASAIQTYMDCPLRFKFSYLLEVPQPPTTYFDIGSTIHSVIEQLTNRQKDGMIPTEETAFSLLTEIWNSNSFESETQENQAKQKAKDMIRSYLKWVSLNPNVPIATEKEFRIELGGVPFVGFIDRIEQRSDGEIEIVDFKTGGVYENSKSIRENPQINIYVMGIKKVYNKLPRKASLYYVKHDKTVSYDIDISQLEKVKTNVEEKVNDILNEEFDPTPSYATCRTCSYWSICDSKQIEE
jgi:DNA helicase-2/ATP-dependent DNA helicase PcrA